MATWRSLQLTPQLSPQPGHLDLVWAGPDDSSPYSRCMQTCSSTKSTYKVERQYSEAASELRRLDKYRGQIVSLLSKQMFGYFQKQRVQDLTGYLPLYLDAKQHAGTVPILGKLVFW